MAVSFRTPGIQRSEKDISEVISPAGTSTGVIIGGASQGRVNSRELITTDKKFIEKFGTPSVPSASTADYGIYGALEFLQESESLYYTRVTNGDEQYANLFSPQEGGTSATSAVGSVTILADSTSAYSSIDANTNTINNDIDTFTGTSADGSNASLLVASIGPGTYGNNVGVVITTCASYSTESSANSVEWAWDYDDTEADGTPSSASDAKWKKVFRVDVYVRESTNDSFPAEAEETFLGTAGDLLAPNGSQLNIEEVINGRSQYIYVNNLMTAGQRPEETGNLATVATPTVSVTPLVSGVDSSSDVLAGRVVNGLENFYNDREKVEFNILINTWADTSNSNTVANAIAGVVNNRRDSIGTTQVGYNTDLDAQTIIDLANAQSFPAPSYMAKYTGWSLIFDSFNDKKVFIPNSIYGGVIMARTDRIAETWFAPAGINRGVLPVLGQNVIYNKANLGNLYANNINPIMFIKGQGSTVWGQKTAQRKKSALSEIAVRRMLLFVENSIEPDLMPFIFEPNNESVRLRVFTVIDNFLSTVRAGGGMENYLVKVDDTNNSPQDKDNNLLNVDVYVTPVRAIEFIRLQMIITRSGVNLAEISA